MLRMLALRGLTVAILSATPFSFVLGTTNNFAFATIDVPGATATAATGINARGQIVGIANYQGTAHGFLLDQGVLTSIDVPGSVVTAAFGINAQSQIVGYYYKGICPVPSCFVHGFLLDQGAFTSIDVPGALSSQAFGINAQGQIVGGQQLSTAPVRSQGFLLDHGAFVSIEVPGANTTASGINDRGQIVGEYRDGQGLHGFLLDQGTFTSIDVPGGTVISTHAFGINTWGQIVGQYTGQDNRIHGFLLDGGTLIAVDVPGATHTIAYGINDDGQIVGQYTDTADRIHGFVATPIGEPIDTTPPVISGMPSANCTIWPPNRKLVQVATVTATDTQSGIGAGSLTITGSINEPFDPREPDIVITPKGSGALVVQLRADRLGNGRGRVYTLTATAVDLAGNRATVTSTCAVPHDQGK